MNRTQTMTMCFPAQALAASCVAAALAGFAGLAGCDRAAPAAMELPTPKVTTTPVTAHQTVDVDEYTGKTEASAAVEVRARVFGYLKSVDFGDGDFVTENQPLFTIESDEYQAIYQQSLSKIDLHTANHNLALAKHARDEKLVKTGAVSKEEFEESLAAVQASAAAITAAKADANRTAIDLKYTVIRAPISGRIDRALVTKGHLLTGGQTAGTLLTKIVSEQPMYVYFDVDERSLLRYMRQRASSRETAPGSLRDLNLPVYLALSDEREFAHAGRLDFIETEVSRTTGTVRIRGVFANRDRSLASGLFVRVRVPVSAPYEALFIPESAIATDQDLRYVYVVGADGVATRRPIELGPQRGPLRIVASGLQAGEQVIVKGLQRVRPGQKVEAESVPPLEPPPSFQPAAELEPPAAAPLNPAPVDPAPAAPANPAPAAPASAPSTSAPQGR